MSRSCSFSRNILAHVANINADVNLKGRRVITILNGIPQQVPADGNCFFHSFLYALTGKQHSENDILDVREQLAEYLLFHLSEFAGFITLSNTDEVFFDASDNPASCLQ